jgi:drug/metabolite transporter (DMT)-like permease
MQRQTAVLMLVGAALFWSTGGFLIKWVDWHPLAISGMRSAIGAAVLFAVFRPRRFTWSWLQLGAAVAYAATVTLFVVANKTTTAANAILLQYTAPVHVALFGAWFLGEKPRRLDWIALTLVLGGMVLFFLEDLSMTGLWGNLAALASGLSFAWLALFLRRQKEGSPVEAILFGNLLAALIGLPFMLQSSPTDAGWLGLTLLGVFQVGLPYALFARAIREVTALEAMLIPTIEPVLNPLWVLLLLGEAPGRLALLGGAIILTAVTGRGLLPLLERRRRPGALG